MSTITTTTGAHVTLTAIVDLSTTITDTGALERFHADWK